MKAEWTMTDTKTLATGWRLGRSSHITCGSGSLAIGSETSARKHAGNTIAYAYLRSRANMLAKPDEQIAMKPRSPRSGVLADVAMTQVAGQITRADK